MKNSFKITLFTLIAGFSAANASEMKCTGLKMFNQSSTGQMSLVPSSMTIEVQKSSEGKNGFVALLVDGSQTSIEKDVEFQTVLPKQAEVAKEIAQIAYPNLNWNDVKAVRAANIGATANRQDGGGMLLMELLSSDGKVLARFAQIGWGFGVCGL